MPPNRATSGFLPGRSWRASNRYGPVRGGDRGLVLAGRLRHCRAVLAASVLSIDTWAVRRSRSSRNVPGEQVVLGEPPVFLAVGADDLEVVQVQQAGPVPRGAVVR